MSKRNKNRSLLDDRRIVLAVSLVLAFLFWIIVAGFIKPGGFRWVENVSIDFSRGAETYNNLGLWMADNPNKNSSLRVKVVGTANNIASLSSSELFATVDYSPVTGPGEYMLNLRLNRVTAGNFDTPEWGIRNANGDLVRQVRMTFEKIETKNLPVDVHADNIKAAEGFFRGVATASVSEVILEGPESAVSQVAQVVAQITQEDVRKEPLVIKNVPIILLDASGEPVDDTNITLSVATVEVTIPILEERTLPLTMGLSGTQQGFDTEWFQSLMILEPSSLEVAGTTALLSTLTTLEVGVFDVTTFEMKKIYEPVPINLRPGLSTQDTHKQVALSFDTSGLEEKTYEITNFSVVNRPAGINIVPIEGARVTVRLVGPREELAKLLPENITVQIEAANISASRSGARESLPARVVVARSSKVFAIGSYQVMCDIVSAAE